MGFGPPFSKKAELSKWPKTWENRKNLDIILLILEKRLDKHGTTLVHITYPPLNSALIFVMFSEVFIHVVGNSVFLQFKAFKIPCQSSYKYKKKQRREKEEEKFWPIALEMKFSRDHLSVRVHLDCFRLHA